MKILFTLLIVFAASASFAQGNQSSQADSKSNHSWFCMAVGQDMTGHQVEVSGDNKSTLQEAQQSAIQTCTSMGYLDCRYGTCIDEGSAY